MKDQNSDKNVKPRPVPEAVRSSKYGGHKKKNTNNNSLNSEAANFKGLGFRIGRDGAKIYEKQSTNWHCIQVHSSRMVVTLWYVCGKRSM